MIKRLSHVAIWVTDVERSLDFYLRLPGAKECFRLTRDDGALWLVYIEIAPRQFIELFPRAEGAHERPTNAGYSHFCLEVDDIQELHRVLLTSGITPKSEPKLGGDGSWQLWVEDPDGNPFEFHQFTENSMQIRGEV